MQDMGDKLRTRADGQCELCGEVENLTSQGVEPSNGRVEQAILLCTNCLSQVAQTAKLDVNHLYCLQGAVWSEVPAVQVVSWRLLSRMTEVDWARELLDQMSLDERTLSWAKSEENDSGDEDELPMDVNGVVLQTGDAVTLIKDLVVKGANFTAKRGTMVKNIRVGDDPTHIEGRVNKISIMLKTCFLKKA